MDSISILFGSTARVKLMRFFLFNSNRVFSFDEISKSIKLVRRTARTELAILEKAGLINEKTFFIDNDTKKEKMVGYTLNKKFKYLASLQTFLFETADINDNNLLLQFRPLGKIDFLGISGVFVRDFEKDLCLIISMKKNDLNKLEKILKTLESQIGIEIKFAAMSTQELLYRVSMKDRLVRNFFDEPHRVLIDDLNIVDELT